MEGIIYKYVSPSGKVYIGQTIEEKKRRRIFNNLNQSYGGVKIDNARKILMLKERRKEKQVHMKEKEDFTNSNKQ